MVSLDDQFHRAMVQVYENAKDHDYFATYFRRMLDEQGGVQTAKRLLASREIQAGLMRLWELGQLELSVEAFVLQEGFRPLFTDDERQEAYRRLDELHFFKE